LTARRDASAYAAELHAALRQRRTLPPLSARDPALGVDDAYAISLDLLARRIGEGERVVGKKIGLTSRPVQDMFGVRQPDFGFLTDAMETTDGGVVEIVAAGLIQPRIEAEIAFVLSGDLKGPGVTETDVLAATASVAPCFEIVDSRIEDWRIGIVDTVADNASCGLFVLGEARIDPRGLDLPSVVARVTKNGAPLSEGRGEAVQGSPLAAVAWLANTLGRYDVSLVAGDVILSGSLVPLEPARPGDRFSVEIDHVGSASIAFA
jgi:2-oxopent-4-enoate/cis-2-oxohex-4-enoate hydratase